MKPAHVFLSALCALGSGLHSAGPPAADAAKPTSPDRAVEWIKAHAIPFTTPEAGHGFAELQPLKTVIGDARIVALGEPTHGTRECFQMKHRLLEFLVAEMGFSLFSIEANMPEAYAVNDYVRGGPGDPRALLDGMYFWTWNTEEVLAMIEWMRAWNRDHPGATPLQFTGFDMQKPEVAARLVEKFAAQHAPDLARRGWEVSVGLAPSGKGPFGAVIYSFPVEAARGRTVKVSAWIRTENVSGFAGAWWRCDTPAGAQGFDNMQEQKIAGTRAWTRYEFSLPVPKETTNINFGYLLASGGTAWFDDVEITLDGVKYENPQAFTFDFEDQAHRAKLPKIGSGYGAEFATTAPHGGAQCLELREKKSSGKAPLPPEKDAIVRRADELLSGLRARRATLVETVPAAEVDWAIQNARVLQQCAAMGAATGPESFSARDRAMAENVRWILEQNAGQKIVLWAHNGHVQRSSPAPGMRSMGGFLAETHGAEMVIVGFATGRGTYTAKSAFSPAITSDHGLVAPPKESVEALFQQTGVANFLLDLRRAAPGEWPRASRLMRSIGSMAMIWQFQPCIAADAFDLLVWQEQTTATKCFIVKPPGGKDEAR